mgnify:CR=1 FL=1
MSDLKVSCPNCDQQLEADEEMAGETVDCPSCQKPFELPNPEESKPSVASEEEIEDHPAERCISCGQELLPGAEFCTECGKKQTGKKLSLKTGSNPSQQSSSTAPNANTRSCPYCGESILSVAIKCKHCGSELTNQSGPNIQRSEAIGTIALILPICSAIIAGVLLGGKSLSYESDSMLGMISFTTVIVTSILIAIEAGIVGAGSKTDLNTKGKRREGPVTWFVACVLLWIVAFPVWMARRARYGLENRCKTAVIVGLIFLCAMVFTPFASEKIKSTTDVQQASSKTSNNAEDSEMTSQELEAALRDMAEKYRYELGRRGSGTSLTEDDCYMLIKASFQVLEENEAEDFLNDFAKNEYIFDRKLGLWFTSDVDFYLWDWCEGINYDFAERCIRVYNQMKELGFERRSR